MDEYRNPSLNERAEHLEKTTEELRAELRHELRNINRALLEKGHHAPESEPRGARNTSAAPTSLPGATTNNGPGTGERTASDDSSASGWRFGASLDLGNLRSGEGWLNKIGIGLLLFGVAFLFMFSIERGWITPPMRVGFGLAIGVALLVLGLRVYEDRRAFSQVLLGGGVGALYITGFAAFQLYELVTYPIVFAFMVAVTFLSCVLSLRQDEASLSIIGALGGLGPPFLLYNEAGTLGGLILYACLILAGTAGVYFYKGWVSLLTVSSVGGWLVFLAGYSSNFFSPSAPFPGDRWALQLGVTFAWLLFWLIPLAPKVLRGFEPVPAHAHAYAVSTPIILLGFTGVIWRLPSSDFAWITFSGAALYALAALALRRIESDGLSYTHALVALLLLTHTLVLMLDGNVLFLTLAAEAAILHYAASRSSDRIVSAGAHLLFSAVALWLAIRILPGVLEAFSGSIRPALFDVRAFVDLAVITLAFAVSGFVLPRKSSAAYRLAAAAALSIWLVHELSAFSNGDAYLLLTWSAYAVALHLVAGRLRDGALCAAGHLQFLATGLFLLGRLLVGLGEPGVVGTPILSVDALADLTAILLAALVSLVVRPGRFAIVYRVSAHVALLAFLWRELSVLPGGDAFVTISWGAYAAGLLVWGLRQDLVELVRGGLATLFLVVGKLFLVDLAEVEAIWRILLFLGFGGLFLALSYYLRSLWRPGATERGVPHRSGAAGGRS